MASFLKPKHCLLKGTQYDSNIEMMGLPRLRSDRYEHGCGDPTEITFYSPQEKNCFFLKGPKKSSITLHKLQIFLPFFFLFFNCYTLLWEKRRIKKVVQKTRKKYHKKCLFLKNIKEALKKCRREKNRVSEKDFGGLWIWMVGIWG